MFLQAFFVGPIILGPVMLEHDVVDSPRATFQIPFVVDTSTSPRIACIRLFVSRDNGKTWRHEAESNPTDSFTFKAANDGLYWFAVQIVCTDGQTFPARNHAVSLKVFVNTGQMPIIRVHQPEADVAREFSAAGGNIERDTEGKISSMVVRPRRTNDFNHIDFGVFRDLRTITICGDQVSNQLLAQLQAIPPNVKTLTFIATPITDDGVICLLRKQKSLRMISFIATPITDKSLSELNKLQELYAVDLHETKITDKGLKSLGKMRLTFLSLRDMPISDVGLQELKNMTTLRYLYLEGTQVTDVGIQGLSELRKLSSLGVDSTNVTENGRLMLSSLLTKAT